MDTNVLKFSADELSKGLESLAFMIGDDQIGINSIVMDLEVGLTIEFHYNDK